MAKRGSILRIFGASLRSIWQWRCPTRPLDSRLLTCFATPGLLSHSPTKMVIWLWTLLQRMQGLASGKARAVSTACYTVIAAGQQATGFWVPRRTCIVPATEPWCFVSAVRSSYIRWKEKDTDWIAGGRLSATPERRGIGPISPKRNLAYSKRHGRMALQNVNPLHLACVNDTHADTLAPFLGSLDARQREIGSSHPASHAWRAGVPQRCRVVLQLAMHEDIAGPFSLVDCYEPVLESRGVHIAGHGQYG